MKGMKVLKLLKWIIKMCIYFRYCEDTNQCIYTTGRTARSVATEVLDVSAFTGKKVQTYIGFISADGYDIATSAYTGELTIS